MRSAVVLFALAVATLLGSSFTGSQAEARGWGRSHFGFHSRHFVRIAPIYPVYTAYCRWLNTPYGVIKRCYY